LNLKTMLAGLAARYGNKTAVVSGEKRCSYSELDMASNRVANALLKLGVKKGDRVFLLLENSLEYIITYFGTVKIGAIAVPVDPKYKVDEVASLIADCQPKILVAESPILDPLIPVLPSFTSVEKVIDLSSKYKGQFLTYEEIITSNSADPVKFESDPDDIANISYTAGPTFHPHGAALTHRGIEVEAMVSAEGFRLTDKDVVMLFALPLHHSAGLIIVLLTTLSQGGTVVMLGGISMTALTATIEREKVTVFIGVPFIFEMLAREAETDGIKNDLSSLRLCAGGGSAVSVALTDRFKQLFGYSIAQFWGLTEATAHVSCQKLDANDRPGSVGPLLRGWEIKSVDEKGLELPVNGEGELILRGLMMKEYYRNPESTAEAIKDGWLYTGDIGRIDELGNVFITGRKKDMIIIKGQNIWPGDIESALLFHPKVAEAAVIGIPDDLRGEIIVAAVVLKPGEKITEPELKRVCLDHIANYKVPKQFTIVESLPKTVSGRVDKEKLRAALALPPVFPQTSAH
jgi:long-chain acyl-CoA synthetase